MLINLWLMITVMELFNPTTQKILTTILRQIAGAPTIALLSELCKMSHVGVWKAVKRLETENFIILKKIGTKKNSPYIIYLNWSNHLVEKTLVLALEYEAMQHVRWMKSFSELQKEVDFLILYGSILHFSKEANDIDVLGVVSQKGGYTRIDTIVSKIQISQLKKIHVVNFSPKELKVELNRPNKAFLDAFNKGVVLFGQDTFVQFIKELPR
ncbi:MAG: hypothetical protein AABY00_01625 [Nanoarchaeota archaeon]